MPSDDRSRSPRPTAEASSTGFPQSEPEGSFTKGTGPLAPTLLTPSHDHSALTTCAAFPRDRPALWRDSGVLLHRSKVICSTLTSRHASVATSGLPYRLPYRPRTGTNAPRSPGVTRNLPFRAARTHLGAPGGMQNAFASIVQARPLPDFGRPVHRFDYGPELLLKPFRFTLTGDTLPSARPAVRPARHYPRVWI